MLVARFKETRLVRGHVVDVTEIDRSKGTCLILVVNCDRCRAQYHDNEASSGFGRVFLGTEEPKDLGCRDRDSHRTPHFVRCDLEALYTLTPSAYVSLVCERVREFGPDAARATPRPAAWRRGVGLNLMDAGRLVAVRRFELPTTLPYLRREQPGHLSDQSLEGVMITALRSSFVRTPVSAYVRLVMRVLESARRERGTETFAYALSRVHDEGGKEEEAIRLLVREMTRVARSVFVAGVTLPRDLGLSHTECAVVAGVWGRETLERARVVARGGFIMQSNSRTTSVWVPRSAWEWSLTNVATVSGPPNLESLAWIHTQPDWLRNACGGRSMSSTSPPSFVSALLVKQTAFEEALTTAAEAHRLTGRRETTSWVRAHVKAAYEGHVRGFGWCAAASLLKEDDVREGLPLKDCEWFVSYPSYVAEALIELGEGLRGREVRRTIALPCDRLDVEWASRRSRGALVVDFRAPSPVVWRLGETSLQRCEALESHLRSTPASVYTSVLLVGVEGCEGPYPLVGLLRWLQANKKLPTEFRFGAASRAAPTRFARSLFVTLGLFTQAAVFVDSGLQREQERAYVTLPVPDALAVAGPRDALMAWIHTHAGRSARAYRPLHSNDVLVTCTARAHRALRRMGEPTRVRAQLGGFACVGENPRGLVRVERLLDKPWRSTRAPPWDEEAWYASVAVSDGLFDSDLSAVSALGTECAARLSAVSEVVDGRLCGGLAAGSFEVVVVVATSLDRAVDVRDLEELSNALVLRVGLCDSCDTDVEQYPVWTACTPEEDADDLMFAAASGTLRTAKKRGNRRLVYSSPELYKTVATNII